MVRSGLLICAVGFSLAMYGGSAGVARAEGGAPGLPSAVSAYVEMAPTASGPKPISSSPGRGKLSAPEQSAIDKQGGTDAAQLKALVTPSAQTPAAPTPSTPKTKTKTKTKQHISKPTIRRASKARVARVTADRRELLAVPRPSVAASVPAAAKSAVFDDPRAIAMLVLAAIAVVWGLAMRARRGQRS